MRTLFALLICFFAVYVIIVFSHCNTPFPADPITCGFYPGETYTGTSETDTVTITVTSRECRTIYYNSGGYHYESGLSAYFIQSHNWHKISPAKSR